MKERLSDSTVRANAIMLTVGFLAASSWVALALAEFQRYWMTAGIWLLLITLTIYRTLFYQVELTKEDLTLSRLFAQPVCYKLADFVAIHQTERLPDRPLRICFKDGRSFLFAPKLKESGLSLYSSTKAAFIDYWTEETEDRIAAVAHF